jgi:hypothetical protein
MRKLSLFPFILISFFMLVSASYWEGAAELSDDLPANGWYIATNSLPINTVVDVTNLENGETRQLTVLKGLSTSGFLALLSRDAANALGIERGSLSRIRLSQNPDPLAFSRTNINPGTGFDYEDFLIIPDRLRPPEGGGPVLDPSQFVPNNSPQPQGSSGTVSWVTVDPTPVIEPTRVISGSPTVTGFSAPMISAMEKGMYYLQLVAYSNPESVEYEITRRIDRNLPVAIMQAGTLDRPVYRILIGPVSFVESNALLERYKGSYADAFVWQGK